MSNRRRGIIVASQGLALLLPLLILGAAIDWPASLDDPAAISLPRIANNEGAVRLGYLIYLAYSLMFLPTAVVITRWLHRTSAAHPVVLIAVGMATASAAMRTIGIVRWLGAMLPMAQRWQDADAATRVVLEAQFQTLNDFGGAIGELLGVSLFATAWLAVTVLGRTGSAPPRWIVVSGCVTAFFLWLPLTELGGLEIDISITLSGVASTAWLVAVGVAIARSPAPDVDGSDGQDLGVLR